MKITIDRSVVDLQWGAAPVRIELGSSPNGWREAFLPLGKDNALRLIAESEALPLVESALRAALAEPTTEESLAVEPVQEPVADRAAFERHAQRLGYSVDPDTREGREGGYWSSHTQLMWLTWQAALAEPVEPEPVYTDFLRLFGNLFDEAYKAGKAAATAEPAQPVQAPVQEPHCEAHGECFDGECIYNAPHPVQDRLEQLRAFCNWERSNNPNPEGLPHVAEWAVMEIDRLRAAKVKPVKRSQDWHDGVIEGHLRERDYWLAKQAEPVQEPVAGVVLNVDGLAGPALVNNGTEDWHCKHRNARRLYTAPPQRKPLSKEEIRAIMRSLEWNEGSPSDLLFARAVEAAHGIKE